MCDIFVDVGANVATVALANKSSKDKLMQTASNNLTTQGNIHTFTLLSIEESGACAFIRVPLSAAHPLVLARVMFAGIMFWIIQNTCALVASA